MTFIMNMLKKYDTKLLFTDTDSLVYKIETDDVYEDFYKDKYLFDLSIYPKDSTFLILTMKKLLLKWKINSKER